MDVLNNFKDTIKDILIEKGIDTVVYAKLAGLNSGQLSIYSRGLYLPTVKNIVKLANVYNYSVDYMLGLTDITTFTPANETKLFYEIFTYLKEINNVSFADIAKKTKIVDSSFSKWKHGQMPKVENLVKLANYFSVSVDYLIGRSNN